MHNNFDDRYVTCQEFVLIIRLLIQGMVIVYVACGGERVISCFD